jgi:hypothetical protein
VSVPNVFGDGDALPDRGRSVDDDIGSNGFGRGSTMLDAESAGIAVAFVTDAARQGGRTS